jgi:hypothetical protein
VIHPQTGTVLATLAHPFLLRLSKFPTMVLATLTSPVSDLSSGTAALLQDGADPPTHTAEQAASPLAEVALRPRQLLHRRQPLLPHPDSPSATTLLVEEPPRRPVKEASLVTAAASMDIVEAQQTTAQPPITVNLDLALALRESC